AEPADFADGVTVQRFEWRSYASQQERAADLDAAQLVPYNAFAERFNVDSYVRKFRHPRRLLAFDLIQQRNVFRRLRSGHRLKVSPDIREFLVRNYLVYKRRPGARGTPHITDQSLRI